MYIDTTLLNSQPHKSCWTPSHTNLVDPQQHKSHLYIDTTLLNPRVIQITQSSVSGTPVAVSLCSLAYICRVDFPVNSKITKEQVSQSECRLSFLFIYLYLFICLFVYLFMLNDVFCLFVLRFYGPVNSYGHVESASYPLTLFLDRLRPTKLVTSTWRASLQY